MVLNRLVFHLARIGDPSFLRLEIQGTEGFAFRCEPARSTLIPADRFLLVEDPGTLQPEGAAPNPALWTIVRGDQPDLVLGRLGTFSAYRAPIQELAGRTVPGGRPRVLAVANADRIAR